MKRKKEIKSKKGLIKKNNVDGGGNSPFSFFRGSKLKKKSL